MQKDVVDPGGSWWCLVAFQETKVAMEKSSSLGARGVSHILDTSSFSDARSVWLRLRFTLNSQPFTIQAIGLVSFRSCNYTEFTGG